MKQYIIDGITILEPEDGMSLTDGDTYSKKVFLGKGASVSQWSDIDDKYVPASDEQQSAENDMAAVLDIMLGETL